MQRPAAVPVPAARRPPPRSPTWATRSAREMLAPLESRPPHRRAMDCVSLGGSRPSTAPAARNGDHARSAWRRPCVSHRPRLTRRPRRSVPARCGRPPACASSPTIAGRVARRVSRVAPIRSSDTGAKIARGRRKVWDFTRLGTCPPLAMYAGTCGSFFRFLSAGQWDVGRRYTSLEVLNWRAAACHPLPRLHRGAQAGLTPRHVRRLEKGVSPVSDMRCGTTRSGSSGYADTDTNVPLRHAREWPPRWCA